MSNAPTQSSPSLGRTRRATLPIVLWAFGFATSLLLIGMWGRTVVVDTVTVEETVQTVVDAELATERVFDWLAEGLEAAAATDSVTAERVARTVAERPEFSAAVDTIVEDFVAGLFAEPGDDPVVQVEAALAPLVPIVAAEFDRADVPVEESRIEEVLDAASVIELDTGEAASVAAVVGEARSLLTWVVLIAAIALVVLGTIALMLSEYRYAMLRTLSTRVVLSAVTYALLFRVAAWALDPDRGRSPVVGGGSVLLGSNGHVFLIVAAIAAAIATLGGTVAWRRTQARKLAATRFVPSDDDTRELLPV